MNKIKSILITGASSGVGKALAIEYAEPGISLFLCGRNKKRLKEVADICGKKGAKVEIAAFDICEKNKVDKFIKNSHITKPIDLLIANAGISESSLGDDVTNEFEQEVFDTNVQGVLNCLFSIVPLMKKRKRGQIAIMSSLASIRPLPSAPAYSASKAAVRFYGEALRGRLKEFGVKVNVVCPGYIRTPLTDKNNFPMPFIMNAEKAAKKIRLGLRFNLPRIAFPFIFYSIIWFLSILSPVLTDKIFESLPRK